ncbi:MULTISPECIES: NAD-dependent epimerase/dehydratase family protein [unclassified Sphingomonas]|uniref:NAD-dependent epimerase/dehydratase family protein n=1 Tax=Sphingomonas TaxID=13687 RepID=UPI000959BF5A|nr:MULTISPECIES: NAD-dependent epimerase/dehydratase family protein [unclassified Sphingomonas]MBN8811808.1 NAD-dependent epimerase/dehydratase family protein [Sphingomonas sp.]OJY52770.1 MAG: UDP-glucuronate 5-epimerase [Sphingomonas sp. 67-41]
MTRVLVTGSAGFIGFHTASKLLQRGATVLGVDNFSDYYDPALKEARNDILSNHPNFKVARVSIDDMEAFGAAWAEFQPDVVIHLAAQAGVRYSIDAPESYVAANLIGTFNVLELARRHATKHLLAASTSSVYGANTDMPFTETQRTATPLSFYAATKGATELMGHSYAHLYKVPMTFFRFFTVYGPWGRPDMALFKFTRGILAGEPIDIYNNGQMVRDFTYVDDLAESIVKLTEAVPGTVPVEGDSLSPVAPFRTVNIGAGRQTQLMDYIGEIERALGKQAIKNFMPMQQGDVPATEASSALLKALTGYAPATPPSTGVPAFIDWYLAHYRN